MAVSLCLQQHESGEEVATRAVFGLVLRRKGLLTATMTMLYRTAAGKSYLHLNRLRRELRAARRRTLQVALDGPRAEGPAAHERELSALTKERDRLEAELAQGATGMNLARLLGSVDPEALQHHVGAGWALVEFVRTRRFRFNVVHGQRWESARYVAFVLRAGTQARIEFVDLGDATDVDARVRRFLAAIGPSDSETRRCLGEELRTTIFDPIWTHIPDHANLCLVPDGLLAVVPFQALPNRTGGELIDDFANISYLASARDALAFSDSTDEPPSRPLVIGDPDFDMGSRHSDDAVAADGTGGNLAPSSPLEESETNAEPLAGLLAELRARLPNGRFAPLPATRNEATAVGSILGVDPLCGTDALKWTVTSARSPLVLHLATHGFYLEASERAGDDSDGEVLRATHNKGLEALAAVDNPLLRSGLALAGANRRLQQRMHRQDADDGILMAEDFLSMDLRGTELVVLSACDTGLGAIKTGEGVLGLRRAITVSGARTVIMSLWEVPDDETRYLMEKFYQGIRRGESRSGALRQAQLAVRAREPNPWYWGAFICLGNPSSLSPSALFFLRELRGSTREGHEAG